MPITVTKIDGSALPIHSFKALFHQMRDDTDIGVMMTQIIRKDRAVVMLKNGQTVLVCFDGYSSPERQIALPFGMSTHRYHGTCKLSFNIEVEVQCSAASPNSARNIIQAALFGNPYDPDAELRVEIDAEYLHHTFESLSSGFADGNPVTLGLTDVEIGPLEEVKLIESSVS